jgi:cation diffusion facilitator family transporter
MISVEDGLKVSGSAIAINLTLALVKISTGVIGNSYALIADGIESTTDIFSSLIVMSGLRISSRPPDEDHPYGHGKAESLAGLIVALFLLGAATLIAFQSIREILSPQGSPAWYTLIVLGGVILVKEWLFRRMLKVGDEMESSALKNDAWHHRSDAITSMATFIGISIALIGGERFATADDWAALLACAIIYFNGFRLLRATLDEVMDAAAPDDIEEQIRGVACDVEGVVEIEKCRVRKSGLGYLMDLHVVVDGKITVQQGHLIGHHVKDHLIASTIPVTDAVIHIEPDEHLGQLDGNLF